MKTIRHVPFNYSIDVMLTDVFLAVGSKVPSF
jgi:hypothetical protein